MKKSFLALAGLALLILWSLACNQTSSNVPAAPASRSIYTPIYTDTFTPTFSRTPTATTTPPTATGTPTPSPTSTPPFPPTNTPNPSCPTEGDVTANIDGVEFDANDAGHILPANINLDHGEGFNGDLLTFTLYSPATLTFSLCPTDDPERNLDMYIRTNCISTVGEYFNNGGVCLNLAQLDNIPLSAGTYYLVVVENGGIHGPGPYSLRIKSGSITTAVCTVVPSVTPVAIPPGTYQSCSNAFAINGGATTSGEFVATGQVDESVNIDDYYSLKPSNNGAVTVTLDCFDNGLNNVDIDVYGASNCPPIGVTPNFVGMSQTNKPVEQFIFSGTVGTIYYIDVEAFLGGGSYRLTVQTP